MTLSEPTDVLERCTGAALALAAEQPWGEVSLRLIAERAEVPLPDQRPSAVSYRPDLRPRGASHRRHPV
jgi:hypothetical protein